jgi:hypothetical protein
MGWRPQLNTVCGRCGKPRGITHDCVSNRKRKPTIKPKLSFGKCPKCGKAYGANPLAHTCAIKSDFKKRKAEHEKREREKARQARPKHDYTECSDDECKRTRCVAYKAGITLGEERGYQRGWHQGYARGLVDCPREHT